ncbi:MAG: NnrU family protein [Alphaproteobacteria bacterium]
MILLATGLMIWCSVHLVPSVAPQLRTAIIHRIGKEVYAAAFSTLVISSIVIMIFGWRLAADYWFVYVPPDWGRPASFVLVAAAFLLFGTAHEKTNVKQYVRHPLLWGFTLWSSGHLLANGESRSVLLFAVLSVWALAEIWLINRRDRVWVKPAPVALKWELIPLLAGPAAFFAVLYLHEFLIGVSPLPLWW